MDKKEWWQEKTIWAAIALIATTVLPLFMKDLAPEMLDGIKTVIAGLALIFARQAIENTKPQ